MIRTSRHTIKYLNSVKYHNLLVFLSDYATIIQQYIDYLWNNKIEVFVEGRIDEKTGIKKEDKTYIFDIKNKQYNLLSYLSTKNIDITTELSARILKCAMTQAIGMVKSVITKFRKKEYAVKTYKNNKLQKWLDTHNPTKPIVDINKFNAELNSINCNFLYSENIESIFDGYIILSSLYKESSNKVNNLINDDGDITNQVIIPIKLTSRSNYWSKKGAIMTSFLISKRFINLRWKCESSKNTSKVIVGADAGQTTTLTLSNGSITPKCPHGHDLKSINKKMTRKQKGSKAFRKCQLHRINYVNWSIKQLNLSQYKEIRLESNKHIKYKNRKSKSLKHWSWAAINKQVVSIGEEYDVHINHQSSPYKSQRCNTCGWVHKNNRKGKIFSCNQCSHTDDADINSAKNNTVNLPVISKIFRNTKPNINGFYWLITGIVQ